MRKFAPRHTAVITLGTLCCFTTTRAFEFSSSKPWWEVKGGLNFDCTSCGKCCTIQGQILANKAEVSGIAKELKISEGDFFEKHVTGWNADGTWFTLKSKPVQKDGSEPCSLLGEDGRCTVYNARPTQCRTYPFWDELLESSESWEKEAVLSEVMEIEQKRFAETEVSQANKESKLGASVSTRAEGSEGTLARGVRRWDPIEGGCEGINAPGSSVVVEVADIRKALEEQRAWDKELSDSVKRS